MDIRYKTLEHGIEGEAPFIGAKITAISCPIKCKGCKTRKLLKLPTQTNTSWNIISEIISHPENRGIIFSGLEWSEQADELLELVGVASQHGLEIMIHTGLEMIPFFDKLGAKLYKYDAKLSGEYSAWVFDGMFSTIGAVTLDYKTPKGYFLKYGKYDNGLLSKFDTEEEILANTPFGVKLQSSNQKVVHVKGDEDDTEHQN